jgi:ABC-type transport system involved in multi-copper enzyme maturation permease subunit
MLLIYQLLLAAMVYLAWPSNTLDLTEATGSNRQLVDLVFLGQFVLASLMAPSFTAGAISGEKERETYEMLLASPIEPEAIVSGKLVAALTHLALLIFASLPIVMLCLPLGGVSFYEVIAAYVALISSVLAFGMISIACGSFFPRTSSSLVVSYLLILPLALIGVLSWLGLSDYGELRFKLAVTVVPGLAIAIVAVLFYIVSARLLYPSDMGSGGKEVVDLETENENAVGLVIHRDKFPDRLFAPPIRDTLMPDGINPIYDKELRSEIFGQGTLMLRMAIQISMMLAMVLMAVCLFMFQTLVGWYFCYVVLFNVLVGPVFSAGSVTGERERQTLDLLLTTIITPWQILSGKLISGLRVSSVLTAFLLWPPFLAFIMPSGYWENSPSFICYLVIFCLTCLTTATLALFCSTIHRKTSSSLITTYAVILMLYLAPPAVALFAQEYFPDRFSETALTAMTVTSPFSANLNIPLNPENLSSPSGSLTTRYDYTLADFWHFGAYVAVTLVINTLLFGVMTWLFYNRWRGANDGPTGASKSENDVGQAVA